LAHSGKVLVEESEEMHLPLAVYRIVRKLMIGDVQDSLTAALITATVSIAIMLYQVLHMLVVRHVCHYRMRTSKGPRTFWMLPSIRHNDVVFRIVCCLKVPPDVAGSHVACQALVELWWRRTYKSVLAAGALL
jgi:hypothetical protein